MTLTMAATMITRTFDNVLGKNERDSNACTQSRRLSDVPLTGTSVIRSTNYSVNANVFFQSLSSGVRVPSFPLNNRRAQRDEARTTSYRLSGKTDS